MKKKLVLFAMLLLPLVASEASNIQFADQTVKSICVQFWDTNGDGELSMDEAAAVKVINQSHFKDSKITSFNELQYFTGLTNISTWSFNGCDRLTSIIIPSSVRYIGRDALTGCPALATISVSSGNEKFDSRDNCNAIITKTDDKVDLQSSRIVPANSLIVGCNNTVIPNTVTHLERWAFAGTNLTSITIPKSVTSMYGNVFENCHGLTSITIPNSIENITGTPFSGCSNLTSITVEWKEPITLSYDFTSSMTGVTLYVPKGCSANYSNANYWKKMTISEFSEISVKMATSSGAARSMKGYSSNFGLDFTNVDGVKAYTAVGFSQDHVVYLSRVKVVPPNTGIVLKTETPGITVNVPLTDEDVYLANLLIPAETNVTVNPTETIDDVEYRNLMVGQLTGTQTMGFVEFTSPVVRSNNCYLQVPASFYNTTPSAATRGGLCLVFDDEGTTDINPIKYKGIEELKSSSDDIIYDLQGRKVANPRKGLYIKNGKKIFYNH